MPLPGNGGMRLTTARDYTPSGRSIQGLGITPDVEVAATREETARFFDPDDVRVQDWRARRAWTPGTTAFAARSGSELLLDHRRLMTTLSGARNETLPPRLWTIVDHSSQPLRRSNGAKGSRHF